jgi:alpha-mannosidase
MAEEKEIDLFSGQYEEDTIVKMILEENSRSEAVIKMNKEINRFNQHMNIFGYSPDDLRRMKRMRSVLKNIDTYE